jgi:cardiolipin synthase
VEEYLISGWVLGILMIPVVAHRRRLTSALSWLALVFALPWLGAFLYVLFAEHRPTRRARLHRAILDVSRTAERLRFQEPHVAEPSLPPEHAALGALIRRLGGFAVLGGNGAEVMSGGDGTVRRMIEDIDGASHHVHLLYYIVEPDGTGLAVAEALERAAARGVDCRVLADAVGSRRFHRKLAPRLRARGIDVRKVLSLPYLARKLRPLDLRNHRKLMVVDGEVAYTGSMNLMEASEPTSKRRVPWREVVVRVTGPAVLQLQVVFDEDWQHNASEVLPQTGLFPQTRVQGDVTLQVVPSGPTDRADLIHDLLVAAIGHARERVVVTTPYFIPDEPTRVALELAALRGLCVQVVIPRRSDSRVLDLASRSHLGDLLAHGVEVHEHHTGFLHAKTFTADGSLAMIGSANFDRRSFHLNFELNLLLYEREAAAPVVRMQERYLSDARRIAPEAWAGRSWRDRLGQDVLRLLSPLL